MGTYRKGELQTSYFSCNGLEASSSVVPFMASSLSFYQCNCRICTSRFLLSNCFPWATFCFVFVFLYRFCLDSFCLFVCLLVVTFWGVKKRLNYIFWGRGWSRFYHRKEHQQHFSNFSLFIMNSWGFQSSVYPQMYPWPRSREFYKGN